MYIKVFQGKVDLMRRDPSGKMVSAGYGIGFDQIATPERLLSWIYQLSQKAWIESGHITELIDICRDRLNIPYAE